MMDAHCVHKNMSTRAHKHEASVLCGVVRARESISVYDFSFFVALYSVVGAAPFYSLSQQLKI